MKDYKEAIKDFNIVIENVPDNGEAYWYRGLSKHFLGGLQESACLDMSKAGELGESTAYLSIREYCK